MVVVAVYCCSSANIKHPRERGWSKIQSFSLYICLRTKTIVVVLNLSSTGERMSMEFTKSHWFYETVVDGAEFSVQKTNDNKKWIASGVTKRGSNLLTATGRTRKEAILKCIDKNEGRF